MTRDSEPMKIRHASLLALVLLATGTGAACDPARRSEEIGRVRILAIQSEPATANPGQTVRLRALAVAPERDAQIELVWYVCQHPSIEDCAKATDLIVVGNGPEAVVTIPANAFSGDSFVYWVDAIRGGEVERALKAVPVRATTEPVNRNPVLDRVRWSAALDTPDPMPVRQKDRVQIRIGSTQMINEIVNDSGDAASEDVQVRTYTTGGELVDVSGSGASGELYYRAPEKNGAFGAWVVVNDGRGGTAWSSQWFVVEGDPRS